MPGIVTSLLPLGTVDADLRAIDLEPSSEAICNSMASIMGPVQPDDNCEVWITMMSTIIMREASCPTRREGISDKPAGSETV